MLPADLLAQAPLLQKRRGQGRVPGQHVTATGGQHQHDLPHPEGRGRRQRVFKSQVAELEKTGKFNKSTFEVATTGINLLNVLFDSQKYSSGP